MTAYVVEYTDKLVGVQFSEPLENRHRIIQPRYERNMLAGCFFDYSLCTNDAISLFTALIDIEKVNRDIVATSTGKQTGVITFVP